MCSINRHISNLISHVLNNEASFGTLVIASAMLTVYGSPLLRDK